MGGGYRKGGYKKGGGAIESGEGKVAIDFPVQLVLAASLL